VKPTKEGKNWCDCSLVSNEGNISSHWTVKKNVSHPQLFDIPKKRETNNSNVVGGRVSIKSVN